MRLWGQFDLSYRARKHVLSTYVWSRAWFLAAYRRMAAALLLVLTAASIQFLWKGRLSKGTNHLSPARAFSVGSRQRREQLPIPNELTAHRGAANRVPPDAARDPPRLPMRLCLRQRRRQAFQMAARDTRRFRQAVGAALHTGQRQP